MSIDEKVAATLRMMSSKSTRMAFSVANWCYNQDYSQSEVREILKRLELEGYLNPIEDYGYGAVTELGQRIGRHNMYLEVLADRKAQQVQREAEAAARQQSEANEKRGKLADRVITITSVFGTLIVGIWSNLLNQDIKDVKASVDSLRVEMRSLRTAVETAAPARSKPAWPVVPLAERTSDSSGLPGSKKQ